MAFALPNNKKVTLTLEPRDSKGALAQIEGVPEWASSDANVAAINPAADGLTASAVAGAAGTATITATADADLGAGVTSITGTLDIEVTAGQATGLTIVPGALEDQ